MQSERVALLSLSLPPSYPTAASTCCWADTAGGEVAPALIAGFPLLEDGDVAQAVPNLLPPCTITRVQGQPANQRCVLAPRLSGDSEMGGVKPESKHNSQTLFRRRG